MNVVLIIGIVIAAALVLSALARGLFHFSQGHRAAVEGTVAENHRMQNRMMMSRVKWQAITILLLVLLGMVAAAK
jgi:Hypoxia induced protein conserved region